jgi:hypothetical protein
MLRQMLLACAMGTALQASAHCQPFEPVYKVKDNGALTTRPAYTLVDGGLIKSKVRAPVGATCDLTKPTKPSQKDLYASYDSTSLVALCSKR